MCDEETMSCLVEFHGHLCPGLAMGIRAAEMALEWFAVRASAEAIAATSETASCAVDAVQALLGCTVGRGNLVVRDLGKTNFVFARPSEGRGIRVSARSGSVAVAPDAEREALFAAISGGARCDDMRQRFAKLQRSLSERILDEASAALYDVREVSVTVPRQAKTIVTFDCYECGDPTKESRLRLLDGRRVCLPCFDRVAPEVLAITKVEMFA